MADDIDARLRRAWVALCGARAVIRHSPNAETLRIAKQTADRIDALLDAKLDQRQKVDA